MYKSAKYFSESIPYKPIEYFVYKGPESVQQKPVEKFEYTPLSTNDDITISDSNTTIDMMYENVENVSTSNPNIWGPPLWFTLHNMASKYPINASHLYRTSMKDFINSLPYILPCETCKVHANICIEQYKTKLDNICKGRHELFKFFVDFHNSVNKRSNKTEMSYEDAFKMYNGKVNVNKLTYK